MTEDIRYRPHKYDGIQLNQYENCFYGQDHSWSYSWSGTSDNYSNQTKEEDMASAESNGYPEVVQIYINGAGVTVRDLWAVFPELEGDCESPAAFAEKLRLAADLARKEDAYEDIRQRFWANAVKIAVEKEEETNE